MSILKYKTQLPRVMTRIVTLALLSFLTLFSTGCNQDGVGIFYTISQEEKQITSKISEVSVYQVVEVGSTIYALGGRTVWQQSGDNWNSLGGGYAYNIVEDSGTLYAFFNNDDENLDDGQIRRLSGGWTTVDDFSDDGKLVDIGNGAYALTLSGGTLHISNSLTDLSQTTSVGSVSIVGGTNVGGMTYSHYLITDSSVYGSDGTNLSTPIAFTNLSSTDKTGDFAAITDDGTNLYLITTTGQVFSSTDGSNWTYRNSVGESVDVDFGAASYVTIDGTDYLIIGTFNGYYQMALDGTITESPDGYAASYPELAEALVYQVYQAPSNNDIYLATQNGLWKRTDSGEFERQ